MALQLFATKLLKLPLKCVNIYRSDYLIKAGNHWTSCTVHNRDWQYLFFMFLFVLFLGPAIPHVTCIGQTQSSLDEFHTKSKLRMLAPKLATRRLLTTIKLEIFEYFCSLFLSFTIHIEWMRNPKYLAKRQVLANVLLQLLAAKIRGLYKHTTAYITSLTGRCAERAFTGFVD
jgi:hypothetical protein